MGEPQPRRWWQFACHLLHTEDRELLAATVRLRHSCGANGPGTRLGRKELFFKGRKILNGPFSISAHIIVVSKFTKGLACWLARHPLMPQPTPHVDRSSTVLELRPQWGGGRGRAGRWGEAGSNERF